MLTEIRIIKILAHDDSSHAISRSHMPVDLWVWRIVLIRKIHEASPVEHRGAEGIFHR